MPVKPEGWISDEEYVKLGGNVCPKCGGNDIEGGFVEIDSAIAWQEIICNSCNATWTDYLKLIGYDVKNA